MVWNKFFRRCVEGFTGYCCFVDTRIWSWSCSIIKQVSRPVAISSESGSMLSAKRSFYMIAFHIVDYYFSFSPLILFQVTQGTSEFKPTPLENREFFRKSYSVPHTLLVIVIIRSRFHVRKADCVWTATLLYSYFYQVKFSIDGIDETDILADILKPRVEAIRGTIEKMTLSGNHLTPCLQVQILRHISVIKLVKNTVYNFMYVIPMHLCASAGSEMASGLLVYSCRCSRTSSEVVITERDEAAC